LNDVSQADNKYSGVRQQSSHWETRIRYKDKVCTAQALYLLLPFVHLQVYLGPKALMCSLL
jgi:hypothetical protein